MLYNDNDSLLFDWLLLTKDSNIFYTYGEGYFWKARNIITFTFLVEIETLSVVNIY